MSLGSRLDRAIAVLSPEWGARRKLARAALAEVERLGQFPDARPGRLDRAPTSSGASADYTLELGWDRRKLVDRARLADDSNLLAGAILDRSVETVVGEGFRLQAMTDDPAWNDQAEALWKEWSERDADVRGLLSWDEILALLYRSVLRDGDFALLKLESGAVRLVESDEIASPTASYTRPDMVDGIELDASGRPVAFNLFAPQRNVLWADRRVAPNVRVPAEDVVFAAQRKRAGATRGLTSFQGMFWVLDQVDGTLEAVSVATRMAACLGLVIKRQGGTLGGLPTIADGSGATRRKLRLEPGSILPLEPGEDVQQITPAFPTGGMKDHIRELERLCTSRFPVTLEMVLGDYTASNYSNTRNARLEARERAKIHQARLSRVSTSIYLWQVVRWIESGRLASRGDALRHRWLRPAWAWVDPITEIRASTAAVDAGLTTRTIEAAKLGLDWEEEILPRLRREQELLAENGVALVRSNLTRDPMRAPEIEASPEREIVEAE